MTNYTKTTDFAAKDALPSGNAAKIVKGSEIDAEFNNLATSSATKANKNNSALTGTTTFETISDGTIAITAFVDEDNMVSNSATLLPTQQSVKAYVDSQVTAQDLDFQADTGGALSIDLDSETITFTGGTGIDTSGALNAVTFAIDSTVATLTGTQTLSNKTLSTPAVSGNLTTDGLIDGRDVATDGTKLDGIESGATADQTAAEIKTAYESNLNTNAFTDADESKLDGIEASADVTDTANVTAAGALMDSELTSEASVKALNQGVATTDSPSFAGLTTAGLTLGATAITATGTELNYVDGVTSAIQTQLDAKANLSGANFTGAIDVTGTVTADGLTVDTNTLHVDATNIRVGIGTSSPTSELEITAATPEIRLRDNSGTENYAALTNVDGRFVIQSDDGNNIGSSTIEFQVDGSERMRIDSSGRVGIGTSSPTITLVVNENDSECVVVIKSSDTGSAGVYLGGQSDEIKAGMILDNSTNALIFRGYNNAERLRIDSSGNELFGTTNTAPYATSTTGGMVFRNDFDLLGLSRGSNYALSVNRYGTDGDLVNFRKNGTTVGSISVTGSATTYNTSSDQRLKENIADADDAGSKVDAIQVRKFDWIADGSHQDYGMIAQELQSVAPEAVSTPEDPEEMMGVDYSKLVPMLVKEIQSLRARVANLENN